MTLGQLAVGSPQFIAVFEKYGLDYYQKGQRSLEEACREAGLETALVLRELAALAAFPLAEEVGEGSGLSEIIHYIVHHYHSLTREELGKMEDLLMSMEGAAGNTSHVGILKKLFLTLDESLRHHLLKEEIEVFPRLLWLERQGQASGDPEWKAAFQETVQHVLLAHRMMDQEFMEMKKLAQHFKVLNPAWAALRDFAKILEKFDQDHRRHIHLENDLLLRKAAALGIMIPPRKGKNA